QALAWISLDDVARSYVHAVLYDYVRGPVNAVAPELVSQADFAEALAAHLRRPAWVPTPGFVTELMLGRDGVKELALADQKVVPEKLQETGYQFGHQTLAACFDEELGSGAGDGSAARRPEDERWVGGIVSGVRQDRYDIPVSPAPGQC